jgi:hypothetical protein
MLKTPSPRDGPAMSIGFLVAGVYERWQPKTSWSYPVQPVLATAFKGRNAVVNVFSVYIRFRSVERSESV